MAVKKYKGIVVGAGAIGALMEAEPKRPKPATHAGALTLSHSTELVAVVDADPPTLLKARNLFPKVRTYTSVEEALSKEKPDIVAIATPAGSHPALIKAVVAEGVKIIVCEKPIAASLQEAKAIQSLLRGSEVTFVLNYQRRFFPLFEEVKKRIHVGEFGRIQHATCYYSNGLYNNGGHIVDALEYLLEESIISAQAVRIDEGVHPDGDLNAHAMLRTKSGTNGTLIPLNQAAYGIHELHIHGEKGTFSLSEYGYAFTSVFRAPSIFQDVPQLDYHHIIRTERTESMVEGALKEAIAAHEQMREPTSGIANGLRAMAVLDAVTQSAKEDGRIISIPETV